MKPSKFWLVLALLFCVLLGNGHVANAVLPSGNGRTDMAHSLSVALASDQPNLTIDTTGLATSANQTAINTMLGLLTMPKQTTAVTISDATDTTAYCGKGIWVGVGGDVAVRMLSDSSATTLKNVPSGTFVPGQFLRIMSTNTTATNIICFGGTG